MSGQPLPPPSLEPRFRFRPLRPGAIVTWIAVGLGPVALLVLGLYLTAH